MFNVSEYLIQSKRRVPEFATCRRDAHERSCCYRLLRQRKKIVASARVHRDVMGQECGRAELHVVLIIDIYINGPIDPVTTQNE